jgi:hypothetical protein
MIAKKTIVTLGAIVVVGYLILRLFTTQSQTTRAVESQQDEFVPALNRSKKQPPPIAGPASLVWKRAAKEGTNPPSNTEPEHANVRIDPRSAVAVVPAKQTPQVTADVYYAQAREALSLVGADPDAEEFWIAAINDPSLSAKQREDLIEDLNEEGFEDPKHPTEEELPLIVNRLLTIEELAPNAMDQVNADSFAEAYKDLWNMYLRLTRQ